MMKNEKETVQIEPSLRWQQSKALSYKLKDSGKSMEDPLGLKDEISSHPGNGVIVPEGSFSNNSFTPPGRNYHRPMYHQEFGMWYPNSQKVQQSPLPTFQHQLYYMNFPVENQYQYVPLQMISLDKPHDFQLQEFQYFVVIDFEATCDKEKNPHPQEIIEFPSVLVNSVTGQLEASFQTYVRPAFHQHLSDFCKELTGIQQIQVDRGVPLSEALLMHDKWLEVKGIKHTNFAVVTWSNWDCRVMLESECRFKKIRKPPYFNRWINLKVPFQEVFGGIRCNLKEAVQLAGLPWEGRVHCGLDDARNTARLLAHLLHLGFRFSITNSLLWQSSDHSLTYQQPPDCSLSTAHYPNKPKQPSMSQLHQNNVDPSKERPVYCFCGVKSCKRLIRKPGPKQGSFFFGCGNWTVTRGALCPYFEWASC